MRKINKTRRSQEVPRNSQCVKGPFFVQKLQILEKLEKWSIFISVSKLTFFSSKKFEMYLNFRA